MKERIITPQDTTLTMFGKDVWKNPKIKRHHKYITVDGICYPTYINTADPEVRLFERKGIVEFVSSYTYSTMFSQKGLISSANKVTRRINTELEEIVGISNVRSEYKIKPVNTRYYHSEITFTVRGNVAGDNIEDVSYAASVARKLFNQIVKEFKY